MKTSLGGIGFPEGEADEEGARSAEAYLTVDVLRCAPELLENTLDDVEELRTQRHSVLARCEGLNGRLGSILVVQSIEFALDRFRFGARIPNGRPVGGGFFSRARTNGFKHILRWVLGVAAPSRTRVFKVVQEGAGVVAEVTEVESLASFVQEEKPVELLEEHGRRLMDGCQNSLARIR